VATTSVAEFPGHTACGKLLLDLVNNVMVWLFGGIIDAFKDGSNA
jgi:hypothetical protein